MIAKRKEQLWWRRSKNRGRWTGRKEGGKMNSQDTMAKQCIQVNAASRLQDFIFVLRGKENLLAVTQMTNTNIHISPDTDARRTPSPSHLPPPHTHTHTRKHVSMPMCHCEDISTPYHRLRSTWSPMGEQKNITWRMQLGQDTRACSTGVEKRYLVTEWQVHSHASSHKHIHRHTHTRRATRAHIH